MLAEKALDDPANRDQARLYLWHTALERGIEAVNFLGSFAVVVQSVGGYLD